MKIMVAVNILGGVFMAFPPGLMNYYYAILQHLRTSPAARFEIFQIVFSILHEKFAIENFVPFVGHLLKISSGDSYDFSIKEESGVFTPTPRLLGLFTPVPYSSNMSRGDRTGNLNSIAKQFLHLMALQEFNLLVHRNGSGSSFKWYAL
jgi:hypothetical protein